MHAKPRDVTKFRRRGTKRWRWSMTQSYTGAMNILRSTVFVIACVAAPLCFAQWQWIDKDGRKVFSDKAPPSDVPASKIVKSPGNRPIEPDPVTPVPQAAASAPKVTGKDKDLEDKKKQAQAAEDEKKRAKEEEFAKARAENCNQAKRAKATLDSGVRLATVNAKGEREVMDDTQRAAEAKRLDVVISRDCKAPG
jgi:hypothetical protein